MLPDDVTVTDKTKPAEVPQLIPGSGPGADIDAASAAASAEAAALAAQTVIALAAGTAAEAERDAAAAIADHAAIEAVQTQGITECQMQITALQSTVASLELRLAELGTLIQPLKSEAILAVADPPVETVLPDAAAVVSPEPPRRRVRLL